MKVIFKNDCRYMIVYECTFDEEKFIEFCNRKGYEKNEDSLKEFIAYGYYDDKEVLDEYQTGIYSSDLDYDEDVKEILTDEYE